MAEICSVCGLPKDLCVCEQISKESSKITVRLEVRRFGKQTTVIEGIDPKYNDLQKIAQQLKTTLACGGTAKNGAIILQGDHRDSIKDKLISLGFKESSIEIQ
ncbi:MAG: translation initiation factor [Nitrososphaeria archaeon]|nr:translation initiation factor [Nitrososphaeria archaeon]